MGLLDDQRIAHRHDVPTTLIHWAPERRNGKAPTAKARTEAAIVDVSAVGAGIVAPRAKGIELGTRVHIEWVNESGWATVRRVRPYRGSKDLVLYGVEFVESPSELGTAMHNALVIIPQEREAWAKAVAEEEAEAARQRAELDLPPLNAGFLGTAPPEPAHPPLEFEGPGRPDYF